MTAIWRTGHGIPAEVQELADQIAAADAVIIAGPEYNKALSGVLKNALDWVSRTKGNPWRDKPVAIMSATGGRAGGERTQFSCGFA
jgi:chromate reductase